MPYAAGPKRRTVESNRKHGREPILSKVEPVASLPSPVGDRVGSPDVYFLDSHSGWFAGARYSSDPALDDF